MTKETFEFDAALSFAGEDREYVEEVAAAFKSVGIRVFLDSDYLSEFWGEDLIEFFDGVYRKRSRYALIFVSRHYADKMWPRHERRSALARALEQRTAYVLPVRLDDTELDGLRPTIGYAHANRLGIDGLVRAMQRKLANDPGIPGSSAKATPRTERELQQLLRDRPAGWEYLQFVGELKIGKDAIEDEFHDYEMGYVSPSRERVGDESAGRYLSTASADAAKIVSNFHALLAPEVQERAFGAPGQPGDAARIRHLARRWTSTYQSLIKWGIRLRSVGCPEHWEGPFNLLARFVEKPIQQYREFVEDCLTRTDGIPAAIAADATYHVELTLHLALEDGLAEQFSRELRRLSEE